MRCRFGKTCLFIFSLALIIVPLSAGCIYRLKLDRSYPVKVNLKDFQPLAVLPIRDAAGYPESGVTLYLSAQHFLAQKGYTLVNPSEVARAMAELNLTPENLLSDPPRPRPCQQAHEGQASGGGNHTRIQFSEILRELARLSGMGWSGVPIPDPADLLSGYLSDEAEIENAGSRKRLLGLVGRRKHERPQQVC